MTVLVLTPALSGCTQPSQPFNAPPNGFPDLNEFQSADPADYDVGAANFYSPGMVHCLLDWGQEQTVICGGDIPGVPATVPGTGCPHVRKVDRSSSHDEPYVIMREQGECVSARSVKTMQVGRKLTKANATCAVGDNQLVACIDADRKHGFVLQPSGSWTF
jgi:hypothetical protein